MTGTHYSDEIHIVSNNLGSSYALMDIKCTHHSGKEKTLSIDKQFNKNHQLKAQQQ